MKQNETITTGKASFLTEDDKERLAAVFATKEDYIRYMQTLWALRAEAVKRVEVETPEGLSYDKDNPLFRIADLTNNLINALGINHNNIIFEDNGTYKEI